MIIYFDTVKRKRPVYEAGELIKLDWDSKTVLKTLPIYPYDPDILHDPNPRGNTRGGKGILFSEKKNELFLGTYHSILVFDPDLVLKRKITHNLFVNIHEMCFAGENIWVSSTAIDGAVLVSPFGETIKTWWPREEKTLQDRFGLKPMYIDKNADNRLKYIHAELSTKEHHTHLNSVFKFHEKTFVFLNKLGAVVQVEPGVKVVAVDQLARGGHSPAVSADGRQILLCSSFQKEVLIYDLEKGILVKRIPLLDFDEVARLREQYPDQPFNQSIFVRGLEIIDPGRILVGIAPAAILEIDIDRNRLVDLYRYGSDVGDSVHGLVHLKK